MGHIKEPGGVDLIIKSRPLTKSEEMAISEYIKAYKAKNTVIQPANKPTKGTVSRPKKVVV